MNDATSFDRFAGSGDPKASATVRTLSPAASRTSDWEAKLLPVIGKELRKRRRGTGRQSGVSWYVDETYLKVRGRWTSQASAETSQNDGTGADRTVQTL